MEANNLDGINAYLIRAVLFTYFQSGTTSKLQQMNGLCVTDGKIDDIINSEKGSRVVGEALYFLEVDWINRSFKYKQYHLNLYDRFNSTKPISVSMDDWRKWRSNRNRLPNL